ncbi:charged multivesicular body 1b [Pelobates cultripes]|uniref:Charged multivesicular body 1b, partial n=1 Tax=Pelobates cultripes TaxID=61616 RepID=A0AAD1WMK6_PELCU|nr:charged multivesicular body 1b [Pelobates cultripes]
MTLTLHPIPRHCGSAPRYSPDHPRPQSGDSVTSDSNRKWSEPINQNIPEETRSCRTDRERIGEPTVSVTGERGAACPLESCPTWRVTKSMAGVVKSMDATLKSMNLEKISALMDKFENQFETLDVQTQQMEDSMSNTTTLTTPQNQVDTLLHEMADEAGLDLNMELPQGQTGSVGTSVASAEQAIQKGNTEIARIHAENAIRQKNQGINFLRMSARVDAVAARVQTAVTMGNVTKSMAGVVKSMDATLKSMNLEKVTNFLHDL